MIPSHVLRWRGRDLESVETASVVESPEGIEVRSTLTGESEGVDFTLRYRIVTDPAGYVRDFLLDLHGGGSMHVTSDGAGEWRVGGIHDPALDGALEIDFAITPFTNTLPIRRLNLEVGSSAEIRAAYLSFPDLSLTSDDQRYTRISERTYRYEAVDGSFTRDIEVDEHGFVLSYPGLFERIPDPER